ncbi:MAG: hypothetical protein IJU90_05930 [Bacteroidales bacterium]|nr:hypothetical protein [Bacteroidales bacterium]
MQQLIETDTKQYRIDYYNDGGGLLTSSYARIEEGNTGKQELQKFDKEHNMCRILAQNKHDVVYLRSREGYYDILIDGIPADLKKTKSHNHIVKYAKKAILRQHAEIVIFEFEGEITPHIWRELNAVKELTIPCYYFTSTEKIVHIL